MVKSLIAAFRFLTVLPLPGKTEQDYLEKSMVWFPLAGAVTGLITGYGYMLLGQWFGTDIGSILTISLYIIWTRALHLDGYMDTIDGFLSHRDRAAVLKIMKDPNVGSFAVLGIGIWFLVLYSALPGLAPAHHVLIHICTRTAILLPPLLASYPRESGTGKFFVENVTAKTFSAALALMVFLLAVLYFLPPSPGVKADPVLYILFCGGCLLITLLSAVGATAWAKKKIGGITGDVLGFIIESTQLVLVLIIVWLAMNAGI